jgi:hypothetical protein
MAPPAMLIQVSLLSTGDKSVRLLSEPSAEGLIEVRVCGPKEHRQTYTFNTPEICDQFRATLEGLSLVSRYVRLASTERPLKPRG